MDLYSFLLQDFDIMKKKIFNVMFQFLSRRNLQCIMDGSQLSTLRYVYITKKKKYQEWGSNPRGQHVHWNLSPTP